MSETFWRHCSSCKLPIGFSTKYYVCNVSTCGQKSTNYVFCSIPCFERHLPAARHKDPWAEERMSPSPAAANAAVSAAGGGQRRIITSPVSAPVPKDVLVVVSKMKDYIRARYDLNTSGDVADRLSDLIRAECDKAVDRARADGRKIVMARDFS